MRYVEFYDKFGNKITAKQFYNVLYPNISKCEIQKYFSFGYGSYYERIYFTDNEKFIAGEIKIIY